MLNVLEYLLGSFTIWVITTPLPGLVNDHQWVWPIGEVLHFFGLCLLVGTVGVLDLRMLGMVKMLPLAPLHRLVRWGIAGFIICLLTGLMFISAATPYVMANIPKVGDKLLYVFLAGINVLVFRLTVSRKVATLGPGDDAPPLAKVIAALSLFLWTAVIWYGRRLMI